MSQRTKSVKLFCEKLIRTTSKNNLLDTLQPNFDLIETHQANIVIKHTVSVLQNVLMHF